MYEAGCNSFLAVIQGGYPGGDVGLAAFFAENRAVIVIPGDLRLSQLKM
jgi:hypothetical protein